MASTWVLIIVLAHSHGIAITVADFNSQFRCEAAAAEWNKPTAGTSTATARCHQK